MCFLRRRSGSSDELSQVKIEAKLRSIHMLGNVAVRMADEGRDTASFYSHKGSNQAILDSVCLPWIHYRRQLVLKRVLRPLQLFDGALGNSIRQID